MKVELRQMKNSIFPKYTSKTQKYSGFFMSFWEELAKGFGYSASQKSRNGYEMNNRRALYEIIYLSKWLNQPDELVKS